MFRLRRVLFQWGPLLLARLNLSCIEGRVSGKRTHLRRLKSLAAQRLEIRLTTPSLQAEHRSRFLYNAYGTGADLKRDISGWQYTARHFPGEKRDSLSARKVPEGTYSPGQPSTSVRAYPRKNPSPGETIQLAMMRNTFLEFMTLILLAKPDPMIPDETVSVVDNGTPS